MTQLLPDASLILAWGWLFEIFTSSDTPLCEMHLKTSYLTGDIGSPAYNGEPSCRDNAASMLPVRAIWPWPWATNVVQSRSFHWLNQKLSLPSLKRVVKSVISSLPLWIKHDCVHHRGLKEWFRHHKEFMSNNKNCILCGWMLKRERSSTKVSLPLWYVFNLSLHQICLVAYHISHGLFAQLNEIIDSIFLSSSMGNFYI